MMDGNALGRDSTTCCMWNSNPDALFPIALYLNCQGFSVGASSAPTLQKPFGSYTSTKTSKNLIFGAISLHGPTGPLPTTLCMNREGFLLGPSGPLQNRTNSISSATRFAGVLALRKHRHYSFALCCHLLWTHFYRH